jgi:transketolase
VHPTKLKAIAKRLRIEILKMANRSKGPHVGSCLSCIDILAHLYFNQLKIDSGIQGRQERDYFILSKGHGAMALYATLVEKGIIERQLLEGYMQNEGTLPAHLDRFSAHGIEVSTGSLGHGLSLGLGLAKGFKLRKMPNRIYVLMGDGEIQEGSVWEAAMMAPAIGVDNLIAMIDYNNLQGYGRPNEIMSFEPVIDKWRAFGWYVLEADGHDFESIEKAFVAALSKAKPAVIIFHTIKGKGVSFMENELKWHYYIVTDELLTKAMEEFDNA